LLLFCSPSAHVFAHRYACLLLTLLLGVGSGFLPVTVDTFGSGPDSVFIFDGPGAAAARVAAPGGHPAWVQGAVSITVTSWRILENRGLKLPEASDLCFLYATCVSRSKQGFDALGSVRALFVPARLISGWRCRRCVYLRRAGLKTGV
jgi:hypothetical protein